MKKAIVTGSTGFIGSAFVQYLVEQGIEVLSLGRKDPSEFTEVKLNHLKGSQYIKIDMSSIINLESELENIGWEVGSECIFFNLAWLFIVSVIISSSILEF